MVKTVGWGVGLLRNVVAVIVFTEMEGETIRIMHLAELLNAGSATDAQASEP